MNNLKVSYFGKRKGIKVGFIISLCLLVACTCASILWSSLIYILYGALLIITLFFITKNDFIPTIITMSLAFISNIVPSIIIYSSEKNYYETLARYYESNKLLLDFVFLILANISMVIVVLLICFRHRNLVLFLVLLLLSNLFLFSIFNFILIFNIPASICLLFLWLPIYKDNICKCGFRNGKDTQFCGGCGRKLNKGFLPFIHSDD